MKKPKILVGFFNQAGGFTKGSVTASSMTDVIIEKWAYDKLVVGLRELHKELILSPDDGIRPIVVAKVVKTLLEEVGEKP